MRLSNIASTFKKCRQEHRPALLTYTVSGDPNKKQSFELIEHIQLPNEIELLLISTRSEIDRLKILDEIFDQIFNKGIDKVNGEVFQS